jgi:hypothetical protein
LAGRTARLSSVPSREKIEPSLLKVMLLDIGVCW